MSKTKKIILVAVSLLWVVFVVCGIVLGCRHRHQLTKVLRVEPTCAETGAEEYYVCSCGKMFSDDQAVNEIESVPVIEKYAHKYHFKGLVTEESEVECPGLFECEECLGTAVLSVTYDDVKIPVLCFSGDISGMSKENRVTVGVTYNDGEQSIDCDATLKWQGSSSIGFPKKNYTMKLLKKGTNKKNKVEMQSGWGKEDKYCLKANYIDFSQSRNVVSGKIYSQIVKSRNLNDEVEKLSNGGVVDGFPILVYINGNYQGLYTLNIPKDKWMFGMEDDEENDDVITKQAVLMGDGWTNATALREKVDGNYSSFDLEYCSTEDTIGDDWVLESFNSMIDFINNNDGEQFKNGITDYVCVERTIDSMIFTWLINALDNVAKNILWVTYDGVHWFSSMYDMDDTWGIYWEGSKISQGNYDFWLEGARTNVLWQKIWANYKDEITQRYFELRVGVLSNENIKKEFKTFLDLIPEFVLQSEKEKWTEVPSINHSGYEDIVTFLKESTAILDDYFLKRICN